MEVVTSLLAMLILMTFYCSEIQLKSPNWLFGQRKYEGNTPVAKAAMDEKATGAKEDELYVVGYSDLNWLSFAEDLCEEDIFQRYHLIPN